MEWNEKLSVGVEKIDTQHKELIVRINTMLNALKTDSRNEEIMKTLNFLVDYVKVHFRDEEILQRTSKYENYEDHKQQHQKFITDIQKISSDIDKTGITPAIRGWLSSALVNWLVNHINKTDKIFGQFLMSKKS